MLKDVLNNVNISICYAPQKNSCDDLRCHILTRNMGQLWGKIVPIDKGNQYDETYKIKTL